MIIITRKLINEILNHAVKCLPNEACGLLGGRFEGGKKNVEVIYGMTNADDSPEHFSMDPKEQFTAVKDMRSNGWAMLGNFHSHPESPARPSEEDKRLAFDSEASYLILSLLEKDNAVLKSFKIIKNEVLEEKILIQGE